jgi:hypothetical protein
MVCGYAGRRYYYGESWGGNMRLSSKCVKKIREIVLEITPEITVILDAVASIHGMRHKSGDVSMEEAAKTGAKMFSEVINVLFSTCYDSIIKIISVLYEITPETVEDIPLEEMVDMIVETFQDKTLLRFFPRLARLAPTTRSDT